MTNRGATGVKDRPWSGRWGLLAFLMALVLALGACSSSDDETEASSGDDSSEESEAGSTDDGDVATAAGEFEEFEEDGDAMAEEEAMADEDAEAPSEPAAQSPLGAGGANVTPTASDLGRKLIFTAFVTVGVDDVATASAEATTIIEDLGGFLFGQNTVGGPEAQSELIFKVLPDQFNVALERLGTVGELRNQSVSTDDVTERVVDLESRIEVAELGVTRLRAALEGTESLEDYAEVERLLLDRESELEVMRGQLRTLQDRIDLATITLTLTQERVENRIRVSATTYEGHDQGRACPGSEGRSVEEGTAVTVCFEVTNAGDQTLTDIVLTDSVLEIDADTELIPVFGALEDLAPGQSAVVAHEIEVERRLLLRTRVTAVPTDGVDGEPAGPAVSDDTQAEVGTFPSEDNPGFGDGFGVGVDLLRGLWTAITVTLGFLLPLLILAPFVWLAWRGIGLLRRRTAASSGPAGPGGVGAPPPPPPPPPPPATAVAPGPGPGSAGVEGDPGAPAP